MKKYLIRSVKYLVYFASIFAIMIFILYSFSPERQSGMGISSMFRDGSSIQISIFFLVIAITYPFLGFGKRKLYLNGDFKDYAETVEGAMAEMGYSIVEKDETVVVYRADSKSKRFGRMWEDAITFEISGNPVIVEGFRKDVTRALSNISFRIRKKEESETDNKF